MSPDACLKPKSNQLSQCLTCSISSSGPICHRTRHRRNGTAPGRPTGGRCPGCSDRSACQHRPRVWAHGLLLLALRIEKPDRQVCAYGPVPAGCGLEPPELAARPPSSQQAHGPCPLPRRPPPEGSASSSRPALRTARPDDHEGSALPHARTQRDRWQQRARGDQAVAAGRAHLGDGAGRRRGGDSGRAWPRGEDSPPLLQTRATAVV